MNKEGSDSDNMILAEKFSQLKQKSMGTKAKPKRVRQITNKAVKSWTSQTLKARILNTKGKSNACLKEALSILKKKEKERQRVSFEG